MDKEVVYCLLGVSARMNLKILQYMHYASLPPEILGGIDPFCDFYVFVGGRKAWEIHTDTNTATNIYIEILHIILLHIYLYTRKIVVLSDS